MVDNDIATEVADLWIKKLNEDGFKTGKWDVCKDYDPEDGSTYIFINLEVFNARGKINEFVEVQNQIITQLVNHEKWEQYSNYPVIPDFK